MLEKIPQLKIDFLIEKLSFSCRVIRILKMKKMGLLRQKMYKLVRISLLRVQKIFMKIVIMFSTKTPQFMLYISMTIGMM